MPLPQGRILTSDALECNENWDSVLGEVGGAVVTGGEDYGYDGEREGADCCMDGVPGFEVFLSLGPNSVEMITNVSADGGTAYILMIAAAVI